MTTETEKSPREIAESIAVRGLPFSAFTNSVEYKNARYWIANAVDEALQDERERCARIAETVHADKTFDVDAILRAEIASAIRGKS